jgi:HD-GYP domain-containing protein (c-di-GMP phosphodiesterase class II)
MDLSDVLKYIESAAGSHFDPDVARAFLTCSFSREEFFDKLSEKETRDYQTPGGRP